MPVRRIPCLIFQNETSSVSSSTPSVANCGGFGYMPFAIGDAERDAWFRHMAEAVHAGNLDPADEQEMLAYFANAAAHLVNRP